MKPAGKVFRTKVMALATDNGIQSTDGFISVTLDIFPPDNRRRDIDNSIKATLDAMQHAGLYQDDCKIKHLECTMNKKDGEGGRVYATIKKL